MKISIYNQTGKTTTKMDFPKELGKLELSPDLLYQVATVQQKNERQAWAHTKDRSEVRGGGRKPWRQKGTGRARHGSIRSPIWQGGGITFGPRRERKLKKRINKKMKQKAFKMVLASKINNNQFLIIKGLPEKETKTKKIFDFLKQLPDWNEKDSYLLVIKKDQKNIKLAARNIKNIALANAQDLNVLNLLRAKKIIITQEAAKKLITRIEKTS